ncbi:MAG: hypothetical protein QF681_10145 [Vicinamibacterales bacterium]|nr:hypothetical protein [Vicinamibacterales bacterium]
MKRFFLGTALAHGGLLNVTFAIDKRLNTVKKEVRGKKDRQLDVGGL